MRYQGGPWEQEQYSLLPHNPLHGAGFQVGDFLAVDRLDRFDVFFAFLDSQAHQAELAGVGLEQVGNASEGGEMFLGVVVLQRNREQVGEMAQLALLQPLDRFGLPVAPQANFVDFVICVRAGIKSIFEQLGKTLW